MKSFLLIITLILSTQAYSFDLNTSEEVEKLFSESTLPDFTPYVGKTLPGRCFFKTPNEAKTASVLVVSLSNGQLFLAPLSADKRPSDFFDELSFSDIHKRFPQIKQLYRSVYYNDSEAVIFRQKGQRNYEAKIRRLEGYFFVKVLLLNQEVRYCYYGFEPKPGTL